MGLDIILPDITSRDIIRRDIIILRSNRDIAHGTMYRGGTGKPGDTLGPGDSGGVGASQLKESVGGPGL